MLVGCLTALVCSLAVCLSVRSYGGWPVTRSLSYVCQCVLMLVDWLDDPVCSLAVFLSVRVYAYWLAICSLAMRLSVRS